MVSFSPNPGNYMESHAMDVFTVQVSCVFDSALCPWRRSNQVGKTIKKDPFDWNKCYSGRSMWTVSSTLTLPPNTFRRWLLLLFITWANYAFFPDNLGARSANSYRWTSRRPKQCFSTAGSSHRCAGGTYHDMWLISIDYWTIVCMQGSGILKNSHWRGCCRIHQLQR